MIWEFDLIHFLYEFSQHSEDWHGSNMFKICRQWTAASKPDALFHNWAEKSRKTTKETKRKYKARQTRETKFDDAMAMVHDKVK